jgi:hypothetical protein
MINTMKTIKILGLLALFVGFSSCSDDDNDPVLQPVESETVTNLFAPQTGGAGTPDPIGGEFTRFDFSTGQQTTSTTDWDIAFRGTTIAVNGGTVTGTADEPERNGNAAAVIVDGTMDSVMDVDGLTFDQDGAEGFAIPTGSDNGWYNYNFMTNIISKIPGKILVFRTRDGRYAKVEIVSYYLDAPDDPIGTGPNADTPRYYTFDYVYNPNEGDTTF